MLSADSLTFLFPGGVLEKDIHGENRAGPSSGIPTPASLSTRSPALIIVPAQRSSVSKALHTALSIDH